MAVENALEQAVQCALYFLNNFCGVLRIFLKIHIVNIKNQQLTIMILPPKATYKTFRGLFASWDQLFREAADFATELGPDRVISISHSADRSDGVVVVWYWS